MLERLKPLLEDTSVLKIAQNLKYDYLLFLQRGIRIAAFDDTMLIHYVLDGGLRAHGMDELSVEHLNHTPISFQDVAGKGRDKKTFDYVPVREATRYAAEDADIAFRLHALLKPRLVKQGKVTVYETLERPLVPVLCDMEREGIQIDPGLLRRLSNDFAKTQAALEKDIFKLAGGEFNVGSPKQLGDFFFGTLKLPGGRKTKTGAWSTDADVLEELAAQGHEIATKVLQWRQLSKLRGTYTDALPTYINPKTGRVHTSFQMAAAATGRLASTDPNLQNIPIRTEEGRRIRQAFIAPEGFKLMSADYSQIELRLFAHIADIPQLKKAFAEEQDIHAMTASEMFGVPVKGMPREIRSRAKAINFGIIYGISAFGLSNQLGIARERGGRLHQAVLPALPGHPRLYGGDKGVRAQERLCRDAVRPPRAHPRDQLVQSGPPRRRRACRDQRANPGLGRRRHPPRHGAHPRCAEGEEAQGAHAAPGARRTRVRGAGQGDRCACQGRDPGHGEGCATGGASQRAPDRRRPRGRELGRGALGLAGAKPSSYSNVTRYTRSPLPCLATLRRSTRPSKPDSRAIAWRDIAHTDLFDRGDADVAGAERIGPADLHMRLLPDADAGSDLAAHHRLAQALGEHHGARIVGFPPHSAQAGSGLIVTVRKRVAKAS